MTRRSALALLLPAGGVLLLTALFFQVSTPASASDSPRSIALGNGHSCAVTFEQTVKCWGANSSGQLGNGGTDDSSSPVDVCDSSTLVLAGGPTCCPIITGAGVPPICTLSGIQQVAAGYAHTCALTTAGSVKCWGDNSIGQLGDGTTGERHRPVDVCAPGLAGNTAGGTSTCCVIKLRSSGEALPQIPLPPCGALDHIIQITAGSGHTCALEDNGHVWCWGNNIFGQLGDGTNAERHYPAEVCSGAPIVLGAGGGVLCTPLSNVVSIDAGAVHTCAVISDGSVVCWGSNTEGQLGNGTNDDSWYPSSVCEEQQIILAGGGPSCCPIFRVASEDAAPPQIPLPGCHLTGATAVTGGGDHTCALLSDMTVVCWGYNEHGELGDGTHFQRTTPVHVCGELQIAGGGSLCCAVLRSPGAAGSCPRLQGVATVVAGYRHTCAVMLDGRLLCWGTGESGQLGTGSDFDTSFPYSVCDKQPLVAGVSPPCGSLSGVIGVAGGWSHTCAITDDKRILCWGANVSGQLGTGLTGAVFVPAEVVGFVSKNTPTPTATPTNTPTNTNTPVGPTDTPTNTPTSPPGGTNTPTNTPTSPPGGTNTPTNTPPSGGTNTPTRTPTSTAGLKGDTNCDGAVNAIDAALILQLTAGLIGSVPCPQNADVDENGTINPIDSALILQYTAGLIPSL